MTKIARYSQNTYRPKAKCDRHTDEQTVRRRTIRSLCGALFCDDKLQCRKDTSSHWLRTGHMEGYNCDVSLSLMSYTLCHMITKLYHPLLRCVPEVFACYVPQLQRIVLPFGQNCSEDVQMYMRYKATIIKTRSNSSFPRAPAFVSFFLLINARSKLQIIPAEVIEVDFLVVKGMLILTTLVMSMYIIKVP